MATRNTKRRTGGNYPIPFDPIDGGCMHYPERRYTGIGKFQDPVWRDNHEFDATLEYVGYARGRSAAYFHFKDAATGHVHPMFMRDFEDVISRCVLDKGVVTARWTFVKRGMNYGIQLVIDEQG